MCERPREVRYSDHARVRVDERRYVRQRVSSSISVSVVVQALQPYGARFGWQVLAANTGREGADARDERKGAGTRESNLHTHNRVRARLSATHPLLQGRHGSFGGAVANVTRAETGFGRKPRRKWPQLLTTKGALWVKSRVKYPPVL